MGRPLFGRADESAALARLLDGGRGVAAVVGEAGIGKSALLQNALRGRPAVLLGRSVAPPSAPLRPLVEIAIGAVHEGADPTAPELRVHRRALSALLPGADLGGAAAGSGRVEPVVLADSLLRLIGTGPAAAALAVEDLHWADADTLAAVEALADRCAAGPGPLLLTLRPEGAAREVVLRLAQRDAVTSIELGPLPPGAVTELVAHRLGTGIDTVPDALGAAVARAGGRPMWIREIVATALGTGVLQPSGAGWRLAEHPPAALVPPTMGAAVRARLAALPPDVRTLVELLSVAGPDAGPDLLATALGWGPRRVGDTARAAATAGVLTVRPADGAVGFEHDLLRDAVFAGLVVAERRRHARRLLDAVDGGRAAVAPEIAAHLCDVAGQPTAAARHLAKAADRDVARGLPAAAARHLGAALDRLADGADPDGAALVLRERRIEALALCGDVERALAEAPAVDAALAATPGTADRRRALGEAMVRADLGTGRTARAGRVVAELAGRFPASPTTAALVAVEAGDRDLAERQAHRALAAPSAPAGARCEAMEVLGRLARGHDLDEAARWFRTALAEAERAGAAVWRARALHELATIAQIRTFDLGPMELARHAAIEAAAPGLAVAVDFEIAAVRGVRFEPDAALAAARSVLDGARRTGAHRQEALAWMLVGQAHAVAGRDREAALAADEALRSAPDDPELSGLCATVCLGLPLLLADDVDAAREHWLRGIVDLRRTGRTNPYPPWFLWPVIATVLDPEGDGGAAARAETDRPELRVATGADALWHLADAAARGRGGDLAGADAAAQRADERFAAVPAFAGYEHIGRRLAAVSALADGWGDPAGWLVRGERWSRERGHDGLARACRSLAGRAGVRRRRAGRGDAVVPEHLHRYGVTSREMDVLLLVAQGLTNREIALRLYLAPRTVKGHVEMLLARTGAGNRTRLARLLDPGPVKPAG